MSKKEKVFGIGLSRTATTTLTWALIYLGYKAKHFPTGWEDADTYDALTDTPVASAYKELDVRYPSSKFILTVREMNSWLESCREYFVLYSIKPSSQRAKLRMDLYKTIEFDKNNLKKHINGITMMSFPTLKRGKTVCLLLIYVRARDGISCVDSWINRFLPSHSPAEIR